MADISSLNTLFCVMKAKNLDSNIINTQGNRINEPEHKTFSFLRFIQWIAVKSEYKIRLGTQQFEKIKYYDYQYKRKSLEIIMSW
jgi:hypothetical protein